MFPRVAKCLINTSCNVFKPASVLVNRPVVSSICCRHLRTDFNKRNLAQPAKQEIVKDDEEKVITQSVINNVNKEITEKSHSRLFAVVQICGKQFKVTTEDLVVLEGYWPPTAGDKIRLEKVLLVGSKDFSLAGRPILPLDLVSVHATVVEKTLSHTKTKFRKVKRKQYMRINFDRMPQTYLRITSINFHGRVNEPSEIDGLKDKIF